MLSHKSKKAHKIITPHVAPAPLHPPLPSPALSPPPEDGAEAGVGADTERFLSLPAALPVLAVSSPLGFPLASSPFPDVRDG